MSRRSSSDKRHFYVGNEEEAYHDACEHVTMNRNLQQRVVGEPHASLERLCEVEHAEDHFRLKKSTEARCWPIRAECKSRTAPA